MKRIISILLVICTLTLCLVSCGNGFKEEDQEKAVICAEEHAKKMYFEEFDGKPVGAGRYTEYQTSITSKDFVDGAYIITVELKLGALGANAQYKGFTVWSSLYLKYTIKVTNGTAKIIDYIPE